MIFDCIRQGDAERIRTLLAADPALANSRTPEGASLALWAVYTRHPELAPLVLGSRPPDFFEACALGADARIVELLAVDRQLVEQYSADGFTALGLVAFFCHRNAARLLLDAGADSSRPSRNALQVTPLHSACAAGHAAVAGLLLQHGGDPNAAESNGMTQIGRAHV